MVQARRRFPPRPPQLEHELRGVHDIGRVGREGEEHLAVRIADSEPDRREVAVWSASTSMLKTSSQ
jgi:hypothetical protein